MWDFLYHIYRPTYPQFLRKKFYGPPVSVYSQGEQVFVLLNIASANICFVLWTNCNRWPVLSADITGIVNIPLDCVRVISWRLLRCAVWKDVYELLSWREATMADLQAFSHDSLAWKYWQIPLSVWVGIIFPRDESWTMDRPSIQRCYHSAVTFTPKILRLSFC